jgi:hypothetical protein
MQEQKNRAVNVRLDERLWQSLRREADEATISMSAVLRQVYVRSLRERRQAEEQPSA